MTLVLKSTVRSKPEEILCQEDFIHSSSCETNRVTSDARPKLKQKSLYLMET